MRKGGQPIRVGLKLVGSAAPLALSSSERRHKAPLAHLPTALRPSRPAQQWVFHQAEKGIDISAGRAIWQGHRKGRLEFLFIVAGFHKRRRFLYSGIFASRNIPQNNELHDPTVLIRELNRAGFKVMTAGFYPHTGNFAPGRLDGRELAAAIGLKE